MLTLSSPAVIGCALIFAGTITFYRWFVHNENKKLASGDPMKLMSAKKGGVTDEMIELGWRYEMY